MIVTVLVPAGVFVDDPLLPQPISAPLINARSRTASAERFHTLSKLLSVRCRRRIPSKPTTPSGRMHKSGLGSLGPGPGKFFRNEAVATLVAIVRVVVEAVLPLGVTLAGLKLQVA